MTLNNLNLVSVGVQDNNSKSAIYIASTAQEVISVLQTNFVGNIKILTADELQELENHSNQKF